MSDEPKKRSSRRLCWDIAVGLIPLSLLMWWYSGVILSASFGLVPETLIWGMIHLVSPFSALAGVIWTSILIGIFIGESSKK
jgi:hypothetical protein